MSNISDLAKQTLILLNQRGLKPTPENYTEVFEELALKKGMSGGTKQKIDKFKALLLPDLKEELNSRKISNIDEFLSFLISKINRQSTQNEPQFFDLLKQILKALLISKDRKVKEMASSSLSHLSRVMDDETLFLLEKKWASFNKDYDDKDLDAELLKVGIKNEEFSVSIKKLLAQLKARSYERFAELIALCLAPSLTQSKVIDEFEKKLLQKPFIIAPDENQDSFKNELLSIVNKRVNVDNMFIQKNLNFFDANLQKLNTLLDTLHSISQKNIEFVSALKSDEKGDVSVSLASLKEKFEALKERILGIEEQVKITQDSKLRQNYSLKSHILKLDENFVNFKMNYALCVFSVSNYRFIMEKYGVANLSEILVRFKRILKQNASELDELWLLDEKSYLLILRGKDLQDILDIMQDKIARIENFKFIYKQEIITPKVISFFLDKQTYPHLNLLDEIKKRLDEEEQA